MFIWHFLVMLFTEEEIRHFDEPGTLFIQGDQLGQLLHGLYTAGFFPEKGEIAYDLCYTIFETDGFDDLRESGSGSFLQGGLFFPPNLFLSDVAGLQEAI